MTPATSETERVRFHTLNKNTGNRVVSRYIDSVTAKPVSDEQQVKGYERGENEYVVLTDEDLESVQLETVRTMDIEKFVPSGSIEWVYLETPFYLKAHDKIGEETFAVIRQAMQEEEVVGVSRVVLGHRERVIVLEPRGEGIVVWTLRFGDEVRPESEYFSSISKKSDVKSVSATEKVIEKRLKDWSPEMVSDPVQESLLQLIAAKKKSKKPTKAKSSTEDKEKTSNVVNIMEALKKSIANELKSRKAG